MLNDEVIFFIQTGLGWEKLKEIQQKCFLESGVNTETNSRHQC